MHRDATKEFAPFTRSENPSGRHPRPRKGATAKKRERENARRAAAAEAMKNAPQKAAPQKAAPNGKKKK